MNNINIAEKRISVYTCKGDLIKEYEGKYDLYKEDMKEQGCVHFKDETGKHVRIYNTPVIIEEV